MCRFFHDIKCRANNHNNADQIFVKYMLFYKKFGYKKVVLHSVSPPFQKGGEPKF